MCNASTLTKERQIFEVTASLTKVSVLKVYCFSLAIPLSSLPLPGELGWKNCENIRANTGAYLRHSLYSVHMLPALQGFFFHLFLQTWASKILKNCFINILRKTIITSSERWCVKCLPPKRQCQNSGRARGESWGAEVARTEECLNKRASVRGWDMVYFS